MEYRRLGKSGVRVSVVGLGGNTFGRFCDESQTASIVHGAMDLGVNFIDTAESYSNGVSEDLIGKALQGRRHEVVLATKTGVRTEPGSEAGGRLTRKRIVARLEASLQRLQTEYIDVYYLHFPDPGTPIEETLRAMDDMVRAGKVLYPACSNYPAWEVAQMVGICDRRDYAPPVVTQNAYSLLDRRIEDELVPACLHLGLSMVPYSPLAGGFLTGKYRRGSAPPAGTRGHASEAWQRSWLTDEHFDTLDRLEAFAAARDRSVGALAVAWLIAQPVVCSVIAGATSPAQVESNVQAGAWILSEADLSELGQITS
jgi:aryl-alcohol dehydrogenase-like predicted oxidoreductase